MNKIKKISVALAGVGLTMGVLATSVSAAPLGTTVTARHCQLLRTMPAYHFTYQGAGIAEPTGAVRYGELIADHVVGAQLQAACQMVITQQVKAGPNTPQAKVMRELGY